jgi:hypothetical protein
MMQRRKSVLDWLIANRCTGSYILDLAYNLMQLAAPSLLHADENSATHGISHLGTKGQCIMCCVLNTTLATFE